MIDCPTLTVADYEADYERRIAAAQARIDAGLRAEREAVIAARKARAAARADLEREGRHCQSVLCIETGRVFRNMKVAADAMGIPTSTFSTAVAEKGRCAGYTWRRLPREIKKLRKDRRRKGRLTRPVRCVETGEEFASIKQAAKALGVNHRYAGSAAVNGWACHGKHLEFVKRRAKPQQQEQAA